MARRESQVGFPSIFSLQCQKSFSSLEQLHYPLESLLNVVNLNLTLLASLREGTLPGLQLPFMLYDFYLKFQTALAASDLASWSLIILVHMLVLSANDGVHLLILHFNSMTGFPQRDSPQLDRLVETLFAEAHIVSSLASAGWTLLGLQCWSLQLRLNDRYPHWSFYNYRLLELLAGWVLFGCLGLPGPKFVLPYYAHYFASLFLLLLQVASCFRANRSNLASPLPFEDAAFSDAFIQQEILRDLRDQVKAKAD